MTDWTGEAIRSLRVRLGWTQQRMASEMGIAVGTVARWEAGKFKPTPLAVRVLDELELRLRGHT